MTTRAFKQIGFIGLGVMGEPICRNLAIKSHIGVVAFDQDEAPLRRLAEHSVVQGHSIRETVVGSDVVFVCLPSGAVVDEIARAPDGLLSSTRAGQIVIDLGTSSVDGTRRLHAEFHKRGAIYIDAPIARTRAAAEAGKLSVMVGADSETFARVQPLIATFAEEITLCGGVGCGQVVKILNNMLLFQAVAAICEAKEIGQHAGVDPGVLFQTLAKGSADSFALRNHGLKAVLPNAFPLRAFSVEYARKDLHYALELASDAGLDVNRAREIDQWFADAIREGFGAQYWPVITRLISAKHEDAPLPEPHS